MNVVLDALEKCGRDVWRMYRLSWQWLTNGLSAFYRRWYKAASGYPAGYFTTHELVDICCRCGEEITAQISDWAKDTGLLFFWRSRGEGTYLCQVVTEEPQFWHHLPGGKTFQQRKDEAVMELIEILRELQ